MEKWAGAADDRNLQHMADFDNYHALHGMTFDHAIELGCGPFTNLRLIGQVCSIAKCTLLDPLIESYLGHKHWRLTERHYDVARVLWQSSRQLGNLGRGVRRVIRRLAPNLLAMKGIPISELIASPIEEMPTQRCYDLIVIVNVVRHCYDINLIFENVSQDCNCKCGSGISRQVL